MKGSSSDVLGILGIKSHGSGIFITNVAPNSLAAKSGLQRGDQLLSFCGINMRTATEQHARQILGGVGSMDQISINVQYNPNKLRELEGRTPTKPSLTPHLSSSSEFSGNSDSNADIGMSEPRFVFLRKTSRDWGIHLIGGNAVGIFIDMLDSTADLTGLRCGDQILEFNGVDFRHVTLEQAREELQRNCDSEATVLVQHNGNLYHRVKRKLPPGGGGDRLYIRALKDRPAPAGSDEMTFHTGNILLVDNTAFNDQAGLWRAWLLDEQVCWRDIVAVGCCSVMLLFHGCFRGDSITAELFHPKPVWRRSFSSSVAGRKCQRTPEATREDLVGELSAGH